MIACRVCGCTDEHACAGGCAWVETDLCSSCAAVFDERCSSLDEILFQLRTWGWCVTGCDRIIPRTAVRDGELAMFAEGYELDGWWDKDIAALWRISVDRGLGSTRPPFWYALAGLAWADTAWWLDEAAST